MGRFTINIVRCDVYKPNAEGVTGGRCSGSIFVLSRIFEVRKQRVSLCELSLLSQSWYYKCSCSFCREFMTDLDDTRFIAWYLNTTELQNVLHHLLLNDVIFSFCYSTMPIARKIQGCQVYAGSWY